MTTKTDKPTAAHVASGMIYRCHNCETFCDDEHKIIPVKWVAGRQDVKKDSPLYMCGFACAAHYTRENDRPSYEKLASAIMEDLSFWQDCMRSYIRKGQDAKLLVMIIKFCKGLSKIMTNLLERKTPRHIMAVDLFKFAEFTMAFAEAYQEVDENSPAHQRVIVEDMEQILGLEYLQLCNRSMWCMDFATNKTGRLDIWC